MSRLSGLASRPNSPSEPPRLSSAIEMNSRQPVVGSKNLSPLHKSPTSERLSMSSGYEQNWKLSSALGNRKEKKLCDNNPCKEFRIVAKSDYKAMIVTPEQAQTIIR